MKKRTRRLLITIALLVGVYLTLMWSEAMAVMETGMCPGAPTDIPPYPCTIFDYLERAFFSPFAMPAHVVILAGSIAVGVCVDVLIETIGKKLTRL